MSDTAGADSGIWEIPLSALEHYAYCHRQMALIHVEGVWTESVDTVRGDLSHRLVDLPGVRRTAGVLAIRSLPVWSITHGLRGVCDLVEFTGRRAAPIEYKVGRHHHGGPAELQVAGQALCLIEAGFEVPTGFVYSVTEHRRYPVVIDAEILDRVVRAIVDIRRMLGSRSLPIARNDARCRKCSLRDDCLPEITDGRSPSPDLFTPRPLGKWRD